MLPISLKVKNFTSYKDAIIDFTEWDDLTAVCGENGSGKSSIIDMITTALFFRARGTDARGSGMDDLISNGTDRMELEFEFIMNDNYIKIIRRKLRGSTHELELYINGISHTEKIMETQQKITDILKMDYDTFLDTVCISQGESGSFMKKSPNERKEVFVQVLGLDKYEQLEKYTKELRKVTAEDIDKQQERLNNINDKIEQRDQYENNISSYVDEITISTQSIKEQEEKLEKILTEKAQYEQIKKQRDLIMNQRSNLRRKIEVATSSMENDKVLQINLEKAISMKNKVEELLITSKKELEHMQNEYNELSNEKSSLNATNNMLKSQAQEIKKKFSDLKNYNKANCDFCGHQISDDYKKAHLGKLMEEGKKYLNIINTNKLRIDEITGVIKKLNNSISEDKITINDLQSKKTKIAQAQTQKSGVIQRISETNLSLLEFKKDYEENMKVETSELEEKIFQDVQIKHNIETLRRSLTDSQSSLAITQNKLEEIDKLVPEMDSIKETVSGLQVLHDDYDDLIHAWGKSGIQAVIIENALPEIEEEINNLLNILCNGKVNIEFKTQKDQKSKSKKKAKNPASIETLDIIINDENGSRKYETYSGGEKFRVDFACHVGLAKFLAKRAGSTIDFFIIDEGLGSQDHNARDIFVQSVLQLSKIFKKIMIISHIPDIEESFENKILVYKDPVEGSKVEFLST